MDLVTSREVDLQSLLADERMRCEQHMSNYRTLKDEYNRLQEELTSIHEELKQATEQNRQIKESDDAYILKLQQEILKKERETEDLRRKVDASSVEVMKKRLFEEAEKHYAEITERLESEIDSYREQYNHLHFEHTVLASRFQYLEAEHSRALQDVNIKHLAEIEKLKEKAEAVIESRRPSEDDSSLKLHEANREISQLKVKLNAVLKECEEIRAQKEKIALQLDTAAHSHSKQIAEHVTNIRKLESENIKIVMQSEALQKELASCQDHRKKVTDQLQSAREELSTVQGHLEDAVHKYQLTINDLQMEMSRHKGEHGAERELLSEEIRKLKFELKMLEDEMNSQKQICLEKEQNLRQQLQSANEQSLEKHRDMENEKKKLEQLVKDTEMSKTEKVVHLQQELQSLQLKLHAAVESNITREKQMTALKEKLNETSEQSYQELIKQNSTLNDAVSGLKEKLEFVERINKEFREQNEKLLSEAASHKRMEDAHKAAEVESLLQQQLEWEQKKFQFQQRVVDLEKHLKDQNHASQMEKKELQNKLKLYARLISKLRNKLEIQKAQNEELDINVEILKKNVPFEDYTKVKRELSALQKKQEEFHQIMIAATQYPHTLNYSEVFSSLRTLDKKLPFTRLPSDVPANSEVLLARAEVANGDDKEYEQMLKLIPTSTQVPLSRRRRRKRRTKKSKRGSLSESSASDLENS